MAPATYEHVVTMHMQCKCQFGSSILLYRELHTIWFMDPVFIQVRPAEPQHIGCPNEALEPLDEAEHAGNGQVRASGWVDGKEGEHPSVEEEIAGVNNLRLTVTLQDQELMRGVTLWALLWRRGHHFQAKSLADVEFTEDEAVWLYGQSCVVERAHEFLSHSWRDSPRAKFVTLCLYYNGFPAMALAVLAGAVVFLLEMLDCLPAFSIKMSYTSTPLKWGPWCLIVCGLVYPTVMFFWHHVSFRLPFRKEHLVFFDKLCVHQSDSKKKHAAIRSFAAFVGCSDRLLVLWSSAYFSRLWCTLEFATLVRKFCENGGKGRLPCDFQPLRLPLTVCAMAAIATIWLWCVALSYVLLIEMDQAQSLGSKVLTALMALFGMPALMHALRSYTRERAELKTQLKNFDVECAECFSMEDREIILETIRHWFGSLPAFNTYVRTTVRTQLMISIGTRANFPFAMSLQAVLPMCFNGLDFVASARDEGLKVMATALLSQTGNILLVMIAISSCLRVASFGCIHVQRTSGASW